MRYFRTIAAFLTVVALLALTITAVSAHPQIVLTEPAADARLTTAPEQVRISFNEPIEAAFAELRVFDAQGQAVDSGDGGRAPDDPTLLLVTLPLLNPGVYTVVWQAIGSDGHLVKGFFAFSIEGTVETPAQLPSPAPLVPAPVVAPASPLPVEPTPIEPAPALLVGLRALMLIGAIVSVGGWAFVALVVTPSGASAFVGALTARLWRAIVVWLLLTLGAIPLFLAAHTLAVAGELTLDNAIDVVRYTGLGQALAARFAFVLALLALTRGSERWARWRRLGGLLNGALLLLTFSISGHAAAQAEPISAVALDWLHLSATAVWIGGLVALFLALTVAVACPPDAAALADAGALAMRFSQIALLAVGVLAVSGGALALRYIPAIEDLWLSDYGRALAFKLIGFGVLLAFGAYHLPLARARAIRLFGQSFGDLARRLRHLRQTLPLEALLAGIVVALAAWLTTLPMPGESAQWLEATPVNSPISAAPAIDGSTPPEVAPTRTPAPIIPFAGEALAGDVRVRLSVEPGGLGANQVLVTVIDAQGRPREVQRIIVTLNMLEMDMGEARVDAEPIGSGQYLLRDQWFSMVGDWQVDVLVRRADADDAVVSFRVPIGG